MNFSLNHKLFIPYKVISNSNRPISIIQLSVISYQLSD
ncbi:hypothetical protein NSP_10400 [Nodularia spumigena CCY9414]|nr:hypothetical protein NSP_10400 [Nodularia spumigena CCY9414]